MMRITSVFAALALGAMCLAFPASAASVDDSIRLDAIGHAGVDFLAPIAPVAIEPGFDRFAVEVAFMAFDEPLYALSPVDKDDDDSITLPMVIDGTPFDIESFTTRRYDPGWRNS